MAAITAGQASCVEGNPPRILFEGISRSEYPTAPSTAMPNSSLGRPGRRPDSTPAAVRLEGAEGALTLVCISFALRGAPCGDDADDTFDRLRRLRPESLTLSITMFILMFTHR